MKEVELRFCPDRTVETWDLLTNTMETLGEYNRAYQKNPARELRRLHHSTTLSEHGAFAKLAQLGDSETEAVILHNPFATPISTGPKGADLISWLLRSNNLSEKPKGLDSNRWGKLIAADLAYHAIKRAGIRDEYGKPLPVLAISAPSLDKKGFGDKNVNPGEKDILRRLGSSTLAICNVFGYGQLHLGGVSLGASVANETMQMVTGHEVEGVLLGEMPSIRERGFIDFSKRYVFDESGLELSGDWIDDGPLVRTELARGGDGYDAGNWYKNGNVLTNLRIVNAMRRDRLSSGLRKADEKNIPITIEYGVASKISDGLEEVLFDDEIGYALGRKNLLQLIRAKSMAPHSHTENLVYMADVITRSVAFNKSVDII